MCFSTSRKVAQNPYWFRTTSSLDNFRLAYHSGVGIVNHRMRVYQDRTLTLNRKANILTKLLLTLLLAVCFHLFVISARAQQQNGTVNSFLKVVLSPGKSVLHAGEALDVRVEVWNVGTTDIFVQKDIKAISPTLSLTFEGRVPTKGNGHMGVVDCMEEPSEDFPAFLVKHWIAVPPGHFYGTIVRMDTDSFPGLLVPGNHVLKGRYRSKGFTTPFCMNYKIIDPKKAESLPYKAWEGQLDTNTARIKILP